MSVRPLFLVGLFCLLLTLQACGQAQQPAAPEGRAKNTKSGTHPRAKKRADTLTGRAVRIKDGDTFVLLNDNNEQTDVRLHGVDAPEKKQDFGNRAKDALGLLLQGRRLTVISKNKDRYGRTVGEVYDEQHTWINLALVQQGMAWLYTAYSDDAQLKAAEQQARAARTGLWSIPNATPPWEFRAAKRKAKNPTNH